MITIPTNNNLFLKGVFFDEIESPEETLMFSETQSETVEDLPESKKKMCPDKIPAKFHNIKKWVDLTKNLKIKCWHCDSVFIGVPVFIPSYISNSSCGKVYETHGTFCGFGCAYAFLCDKHEFHINHTYYDRLEMLKMLYRCFYNKKIHDFVKAPCKYSTEMYGGEMTHAEFKKELKRVNQLNTQASQ
jgi:hypothetical protein